MRVKKVFVNVLKKNPRKQEININKTIHIIVLEATISLKRFSFFLISASLGPKKPELSRR